MGRDLMIGFLLRLLLIVSLLCIFGADTNCTSLPPKTEKAIETSQSLDTDIDNSDATPEQKKGMKKKNADVRTVVKEQGETITTQTAQIKSLEWYRQTFWQICLAAGGVVVGAIGLWWFKR